MTTFSLPIPAFEENDEDRAIDKALVVLNKLDEVGQVFNSAFDASTGEVTFFLVTGGMITIDADGNIVAEEEAQAEEVVEPMTQDEADAFMQVRDDYEVESDEFDAERGMHLYFLEDGRTVGLYRDASGIVEIVYTNDEV